MQSSNVAGLTIQLMDVYVEGGYMASKPLLGKILLNVLTEEAIKVESLNLQLYMIEKIKNNDAGSQQVEQLVHFDNTIQLVTNQDVSLGVNSFDFSITIPKDAPSTAEFENGSIKCFLLATLNIPKKPKVQEAECEINVSEYIPSDLTKRWPSLSWNHDKKFNIGGNAKISVTAPSTLFALGSTIPLLLHIDSSKKVSKLTMNLLQQTTYYFNHGEKKTTVENLYHGTGFPKDKMEKAMKASISCPDDGVSPTRSKRAIEGEYQFARSRSRGLNNLDQIHEADEAKLLVSIEHSLEFKIDFGALTKEVEITIPLVFLAKDQYKFAAGKELPSYLTDASSSSSSSSSTSTATATAPKFSDAPKSPVVPKRVMSSANLRQQLLKTSLIDLSDAFSITKSTKTPEENDIFVNSNNNNNSNNNVQYQPSFARQSQHLQQPIFAGTPLVQNVAVAPTTTTPTVIGAAPPFSVVMSSGGYDPFVPMVQRQLSLGPSAEQFSRLQQLEQQQLQSQQLYQKHHAMLMQQQQSMSNHITQVTTSSSSPSSSSPSVIRRISVRQPSLSAVAAVSSHGGIGGGGIQVGYPASSSSALTVVSSSGAGYPAQFSQTAYRYPSMHNVPIQVVTSSSSSPVPFSTLPVSSNSTQNSMSFK